MLLSKTLMVKWNGAQRKYYEEKGYLFTKFGNEFECKIEDIPHSSDKFIECECDYCNIKFTKQLKKYYKQREIIQSDCCQSCGGIKNKEIKILKYGTASAHIHEKSKQQHEKLIINNEKRIWPQVIQIFKERNYTLISEKYISNNTPIYYICEKHKDKGEQYIDWVHLQDGKGCKYCGSEKAHDSQRYSHEYVKKVIEDDFKKDNCKLISKTYTAYNDYNLSIKCDCGDNFVTSFGWFIKGKRKCNNCTSSIGEQAITKYLKENNFKFEREYKIFPQEWKNHLYYDFYLPCLNIAIEYDGEQHFKPIDFNSEGIEIATEKFEIGLERDSIKNKYSERNNIHLIRIPYWDRDDIESILNQKLSPLPLCSNE